MSFQSFTLTELVSGNAPFVGLDNYARVLADPTFAVALINSIVFTVVSVTPVPIGLGLAILFSSGFPMSNVFRGLMLIGWQIPVVVTGTLFLWMFNVDYGVVNFILQSLHVIGEPIGWTVDAGAALPGGHHREHLARHPIQPDHAQRGIAGLPIGHLRSRDGRWGERLAEGPPYDGTAASSDDPGRPDARLHLHAAGLRPDLDHDQGRTRQRHEVLPTFAYRLAFVHFDFGESSAVAVFISAHPARGGPRLPAVRVSDES